MIKQNSTPLLFLETEYNRILGGVLSESKKICNWIGKSKWNFKILWNQNQNSVLFKTKMDNSKEWNSVYFTEHSTGQDSTVQCSSKTAKGSVYVWVCVPTPENIFLNQKPNPWQLIFKMVSSVLLVLFCITAEWNTTTRHYHHKWVFSLEFWLALNLLKVEVCVPENCQTKCYVEFFFFLFFFCL